MMPPDEFTMVELRRFELLSKKSLLTTNLILTLQVLDIPFDPHLFTKYQSQERVLMLKLSTQEPIRINLFVRQSLLVNTIMLSLIAYWYLHKSYLSLTTQMKRN